MFLSKITEVDSSQLECSSSASEAVWRAWLGKFGGQLWTHIHTTTLESCVKVRPVWSALSASSTRHAPACRLTHHVARHSSLINRRQLCPLVVVSVVLVVTIIHVIYIALLVLLLYCMPTFYYWHWLKSHIVCAYLCKTR